MIAATFAAEGAHLFLTGRTLSKLENLAADISAEGGRAEVAELDALDEAAVEEHARGVVAAGALQRARATLQERLPERSTEWSAPAPTNADRELLAKYIDAHERQDVETSVALARDDIRITMPPHPWCFDGMDEWLPRLRDAFGPGSIGDWRLVATAANRMPAAASYLRQSDDDTFRAFKLNVIRIEGGKIAEVTTFDAHLFPEFGLPPTL